MKNVLFKLCFLTLFVSACVKQNSGNKIFLNTVVPEEKGFSSQKLDSLGLFLEKAGSSSLLILVDGKLSHSHKDLKGFLEGLKK